jgi:hypothetical protein
VILIDSRQAMLAQYQAQKKEIVIQKKSAFLTDPPTPRESKGYGCELRSLIIKCFVIHIVNLDIF